MSFRDVADRLGMNVIGLLKAEVTDGPSRIIVRYHANEILLRMKTAYFDPTRSEFVAIPKSRFGTEGLIFTSPPPTQPLRRQPRELNRYLAVWSTSHTAIAKRVLEVGALKTLLANKAHRRWLKVRAVPYFSPNTMSALVLTWRGNVTRYQKWLPPIIAAFQGMLHAARTASAADFVQRSIRLLEDSPRAPLRQELGGLGLLWDPVRARLDAVDVLTQSALPEANQSLLKAAFDDMPGVALEALRGLSPKPGMIADLITLCGRYFVRARDQAFHPLVMDKLDELDDTQAARLFTKMLSGQDGDTSVLEARHRSTWVDVLCDVVRSGQTLHAIASARILARIRAAGTVEIVRRRRHRERNDPEAVAALDQAITTLSGFQRLPRPAPPATSSPETLPRAAPREAAEIETLPKRADEPET